MSDFSLNLICEGFEENFLVALNTENITILRKGEAWRKQIIKNNIIILTLQVTMEHDYGIALNNLIEQFEVQNPLQSLVLNSRYVEIQFSISVNDNLLLPCLHLTNEQLEFISKINAELDFSIHW